VFPAILAAIQAVKGIEDKRKQQDQARYRAAAQGQAAAYPQQSGGGLGDAAQIAGGIVGGDSGKTLSSVGGVLGGQSSGIGGALGGLLHPQVDASASKPAASSDNDDDDMFGGIGR